MGRLRRSEGSDRFGPKGPLYRSDELGAWYLMPVRRSLCSGLSVGLALPRILDNAAAAGAMNTVPPSLTSGKTPKVPFGADPP
jgi:hypothetical protein